ncbi:putative F-box protein At1g19160 [Apium graveolens]|uniref:putative F-box protein At1g19160 n=1 Tax=Apium graveolens TaxID=4045 RepID=UPI003D791CE7
MDFLEIFPHLPAKSIFKFSVVSKECHEILSWKLLANKQCKNLEGREDSCFFIQPKSAPTSLQLNYLCETSKSFCGFPSASLEFLSTKGSMIASYNGLLCCKNLEDAEYPLFLCNPVTKTWLPIIKPTSDFKIDYPFSFILVCNIDDYNHEDDYKLMYVGSFSQDVWNTNTKLCRIYWPQKKVWEEYGEMVIGSRSIDFGSAAYLKNDGGTIHFMSDWGKYIAKNSPFYWPYIVSYNIRSSISKFLKIPRPARKGIFDSDCSCKFGVFKFKDPRTGKESICLIKLMKLVFSIWILTDAHSNKWKIILKSRSKAMGLYDDLKPTISGFSVINGNLLVIATGDNQLYRYPLTRDGIMSSKVKRAELIGCHQYGMDDLCFYSYSNTLRPCGDGAVPFPQQ